MPLLYSYGRLEGAITLACDLLLERGHDQESLHLRTCYEKNGAAKEWRI